MQSTVENTCMNLAVSMLSFGGSPATFTIYRITKTIAQRPRKVLRLFISFPLAKRVWFCSPSMDTLAPVTVKQEKFDNGEDDKATLSGYLSTSESDVNEEDIDIG